MLDMKNCPGTEGEVLQYAERSKFAHSMPVDLFPRGIQSKA